MNRYWHSPETTGINRLPILSLEHVEKISLDGTWKFQLLDHPSYDVRRKWSSLLVPGYMPTAEQLLPDFPHLPLINPTGIFERDFELPISWQKRRIVLHIGACQSLGIISVNGHEVGVTKDSHIASEFDISNYIRRGKNTVRIRVAKFSDASYLEDESDWRFGGLPRSVKVFVTSEVFIEQFRTTTDLNENSTTGTLEIDATIASLGKKDLAGYQLRVSVPELPKQKNAQISGVISDGMSGNLTIRTSLAHIQAWSSEAPNLYTLDIELIDPQGLTIEVTHQKIGFRHIELDDGQLYINDQAIELFHDPESNVNLESGQILNREVIRNSILDLKRRNYNTVFTTEYANDPVLLDICDELGVYALAEPNIGFSGLNEKAATTSSYLNAFMQRASRLVSRDIHHPSLIMWSLRKAQAKKSNVASVAAYFEATDETRALDYRGSVKNLFAPKSTPRGPVSITSKAPSTGNFLLANNQNFVDLTQLLISWSITHNEIVVERGNISAIDLAPRSSKKLSLKSKNLGKSKMKTVITFTVAQKNSTPWAPSLSEIQSFEFVLPIKR